MNDILFLSVNNMSSVLDIYQNNRLDNLSTGGVFRYPSALSCPYSIFTSKHYVICKCKEAKSSDKITPFTLKFVPSWNSLEGWATKEAYKN